MKKLFLFSLLILFYYHDIHTNNSSNTDNKQKIIIIHGSSSAGKTSIIKAIQKLSEVPLLTIGIDLLWEIIPPQYHCDGSKYQEGFFFTYGRDEQDEPIIVSIQVGPFLKSLHLTRSSLIKSLTYTGYDAIVDEIFLEETILHHYVDAFKDYTVYFIGAICKLEELERREKARGDREAGLARWQINIAHKYSDYYDYTVDTTHTSAIECAQLIMDFIKNNPHPMSFKQLQTLFFE